MVPVYSNLAMLDNYIEPRIFIIEDDPAIVRSLQWLFESVQLKVETFLSPLKFLNHCSSKLRGCILTDLRMPEMSGLDLLKEIRLINKQIHIIVMSAHADVPMAVRAMKQGANDFITKPFNEQALLDIIQRILREKQQLTTTDSESIENQKKILSQLTLRESQVLKLIIEGKLNKQIADELKVSISTVEAHRAKLMRKLQVRTMAQLIKLTLNLDPAY